MASSSNGQSPVPQNDSNHPNSKTTDTPSTAPQIPSDPRDAIFQTDHLLADLKGRSVRGGMVTMGGQGGKLLLTMVSQFILCRLVSPEDFGLFFMTATLTAFAEIFKEMGLSMAVVQKKDVKHLEVSNVFWLNAGVGFLMMLIVAGCGPLLMMFFTDKDGNYRPEIVPITIAVSTTFFAAGVTAMHRAIMNRRMKYSALTLNELDSLVISIAAAVLVAYGAKHWGWFGGNGYWALVVQRIVAAFSQAIGAWILSPWRPSLPRFNVSIRSYVSFGASMTSFQVVNYFSRNLDKVLIGKVWGDVALGFYGTAYKLLLMPIWQVNTPITRVALPTLSRLQHEPEKYRQYYRRAIGLLTFFTMPMVMWLSVSADKAIPVLLGPQWIGSVLIFQVLAPAALFGTFNVATGWVYASLGRPHRQFTWGLVSTSACVIGFLLTVWEWPLSLIGLQGGPVAVAASFSVTFCCVTMGPFAFVHCFKGTPLKLNDVWKALYRQFIACIVAAAVVLTVDKILFPNWHGTHLWLGLIGDGLIFGVGYVATFSVLPNGVRYMRVMLRLKEVLKGPDGGKGKGGAGTPDPSRQDSTRPQFETSSFDM